MTRARSAGHRPCPSAQVVVVGTALLAASCGERELPAPVMDFDAERSRVWVDRPGGVLADGVDAATVSVLLYNTRHEPLSGIPIRLTSSAAAAILVQPASPTDPYGLVTGTVASTAPGNVEVVVVADPGNSAVELRQRPVVTFVECKEDLHCQSPGPCELALGAACRDTACAYPLAPPATACEDGDPCSGNESCDEAGACLGAPQPGASCDDGDACTIEDTCDSAGACAGTPNPCDDPPVDTCLDAGRLLTHAAFGACDPSNGTCAYAATEVSCLCFQDACCAPQGCAVLGYECGTGLVDNCGQPLDCPACPTHAVCGVDHQCSCPNTTCGTTCCPPGDICYPAGTCCTRLTCATAGRECGSTWSDGCGGTLSCGTCGTYERCTTEGQCACRYSECGGTCCAWGDVCNGSACCDPDCSGKCVGAANGCGGTCTSNGCSGCCDPAHACIAYGAQSTGQCGSYGQSCDDCSLSGRICYSGYCCVAEVGGSCDTTCVEYQGPVRAYTQFASVFCSDEGQSVYSVTNCSAADPDPCTTNGQPAGCGLIAGYTWCDVTCRHEYACTGSIDCDGYCY